MFTNFIKDNNVLNIIMQQLSYDKRLISDILKINPFLDEAKLRNRFEYNDENMVL